ncbi:MAG: thioredoxin [Phycisphaerales bacterium]
MSNVLHPTAASFQEEVVNSPVPVLVDFWAPWCPPCRMLKPIVESLAEDMAGSAKNATINVDDEPELAAKFGVRSIPALMIMHKGQVADQWVGYSPKQDLVNRLNAVIDS